jgi:hypothetical protein
MDDLPRPKYMDSNPLKVPFLARVNYDGNGFESFPSRYGFDLRDRSAFDIASFAQAWLYFGLLAEFIGEPISPFVSSHQTSENGTEFVSFSLSKNLMPLLRPLEVDADEVRENDESDNDGRDYTSGKNNKHKLLFFAHQQYMDIDKMYHQSSFEPLAIILLSINVLIDTLLFTCLGFPLYRIIPLAKTNPEPTLVKTLLTRLMTSNGWCPVQIQYILRSFNAPLISYISQIRRRNRPEVTHQKCEDVCIAYNIDEEKYKTNHERDGCECSFISIPVSEMRSIVEGGGIPIAFLKTGNDGKISLGVKAATATDSYIAFSHVWSDGLGNTKGNSLPECQIKRLAKYVNNSPKLTSNFARGHFFSVDTMRLDFSDRPKFFWIDTLCIPVGDKDDDYAHISDLRQRAIGTITPTFARANRVIILDEEMERIDQEHTDSCETLACLLFSAWMGRCWTLPEGALNRGSQIRCLHGSIDLTSVTSDLGGSLLTISNPEGSLVANAAKDVWNGAVKPLLQRLYRKTSDPTRYMRNFDQRMRKMLVDPLKVALDGAFLADWQEEHRNEEADDQYLEHFLSCWNSLGSRQTSKSKDRVKILATLLDLNISQVMRCNPPMSAVIRSLPAVPLSMLYIIRSDAEERDQAAMESLNVAAGTAQDELKRWLPLCPSNWGLTPPSMTWEDEWLVLKRRPFDTHLLLIEPDLWNAHKAGNIIVDMQRNKTRYRVEFIRKKDDDFHKARSGGICLLMEGDVFQQGPDWSPALKLKGACLYVSSSTLQHERLKMYSRREGSPRGCIPGERIPGKRPPKTIPTLHISAIYDCPLRISLLPNDSDTNDDGDLVIPFQPVRYWSLQMRHSKSSCPAYDS